jgi:hypothetical protein
LTVEVGTVFNEEEETSRRNEGCEAGAEKKGISS